MQDQPIGLCQCGCGQRTALADKTRPARGDIKGQPRKYVKGHNRRRTVEDFAVDEAGCWTWLRSLTTKGYGCAWNGEKLVLAHRLYYERLVGVIPEGLHVDHLCRNRACVNPAHMEPVTCAENLRRGRVARAAS